MVIEFLLLLLTLFIDPFIFLSICITFIVYHIAIILSNILVYVILSITIYFFIRMFIYMKPQWLIYLQKIILFDILNDNTTLLFLCGKYLYIIKIFLFYTLF